MKFKCLTVALAAIPDYSAYRTIQDISPVRGPRVVRVILWETNRKPRMLRKLLAGYYDLGSLCHVSLTATSIGFRRDLILVSRRFV